MARIKRHGSAYAVLIATSVILFWRGAWGLMDLFLFPHNALLSYISSVVLGIAILVITHKLVDELL